MNEYLRKVFKQIKDFFVALPPGRKLATVGVGAGIVAVIAALFIWAGDTSYQPLMTNLTPEDSSNIIRILRDKRIPFKVDPTGRNILVPSEDLLTLRLELATMGLPQTSVVGYEVFDKQTLGTTSFVQKVNQKRALEGELMRTIGTIRGVKRARIHLAMPQKSAFVEDQKKSTASVVVDLEPGVVLSEKQIYGIGNLVARAVEGMDVNDVAIVDSSGKVLSKNAADPLSLATATQLEFRQKIEGDLERRVEAMLSRVVGEGKVVAKISADLDFSQVNETQTLYDQEGATVRSKERNIQSMLGARPAPYGPAGATSNTPGGPVGAQVGEVKNDTKRENSVENYDIPQTVRRTVKPSGTITKLSVAVVVDGKQVKTTDKDGIVSSKVEPWSPEKLKEFESVVSTAVGIDKKRGDILEVKNMEFKEEDFDAAQRQIEDAERRAYIRNLITYVVAGIAIVLFFFFVVRPFVKWVTENTIDSVDTFLPQTIEELERLRKNSALPEMETEIPVVPDNIDPEKVEGDMIREKIVTLVDANPYKAALILQEWLRGAAASAGDGKGGGGKKDGKGGGKGKTA